MQAKSELLKFSIKLAKESTKILLKAQQKARIVQDKGKGDFALDADISSENHIIKRIQEKYPEHDILANRNQPSF